MIAATVNLSDETIEKLADAIAKRIVVPMQVSELQIHAVEYADSEEVMKVAKRVARRNKELLRRLND